MMSRSQILPVGVLLCASRVFAADIILESSTSWDGGAIAYPGGEPLIVSEILRLQPGQVSPWHCHPVPTLGYVIDGPVKVETSNGDSIVLQPGESAVEVMRTVHRGVALETPAKILVFYASEKGAPVTVKPDAANAAEHCDLPAAKEAK